MTECKRFKVGGSKSSYYYIITAFSVLIAVSRLTSVVRLTPTPPANTRVPTAKYTKMGETLRHVIPGHMQCSMACGGKACKYENPSRWSDEEQAVKGLYSSWWVPRSLWSPSSLLRQSPPGFLLL